MIMFLLIVRLQCVTDFLFSVSLGDFSVFLCDGYEDVPSPTIFFENYICVVGQV